MSMIQRATTLLAPAGMSAVNALHAISKNSCFLARAGNCGLMLPSLAGVRADPSARDRPVMDKINAIVEEVLESKGEQLSFQGHDFYSHLVGSWNRSRRDHDTTLVDLNLTFRTGYDLIQHMVANRCERLFFTTKMMALTRDKLVDVAWRCFGPQHSTSDCSKSGPNVCSSPLRLYLNSPQCESLKTHSMTPDQITTFINQVRSEIQQRLISEVFCAPRTQQVDRPDQMACFLRRNIVVRLCDNRLVYTDFGDYPQLTTALDLYLGKGTVERILREYDRIPPSQRFDKNDSYSQPHLAQTLFPTTLSEKLKTLQSLEKAMSNLEIDE